MALGPLTFAQDGAAHHPGAAVPLLPALDRIAAAQPQHRAGTRLHGLPEVSGLLATGPILHASAATIGQRRRRVLQVDYAAQPLDPPLEWLGV
jgi:hypothetical protein